jgi:hypothetical protein
MSIQVSTFNDKELKAAIKTSPKLVQDYLEAQQHALDGYRDTLAQAMKKIFELSKPPVDYEEMVIVRDWIALSDTELPTILDRMRNTPVILLNKGYAYTLTLKMRKLKGEKK